MKSFFWHILLFVLKAKECIEYRVVINLTWIKKIFISTIAFPNYNIFSTQSFIYLNVSPSISAINPHQEKSDKRFSMISFLSAFPGPPLSSWWHYIAAIPLVGHWFRSLSILQSVYHYFTHCEIFTPALAGGLSLVSKGQQVSLGLQDSS